MLQTGIESQLLVGYHQRKAFHVKNAAPRIEMRMEVYAARLILFNQRPSLDAVNLSWKAYYFRSWESSIYE